MARWLYTIDLSGVLNKVGESYDLTRFEEDCPDDVKEAIAAEVEKAPPLARFAELFRNAKSIAEVNRVLNDVYDVADRQRVWCGI